MDASLQPPGNGLEALLISMYYVQMVHEHNFIDGSEASVVGFGASMVGSRSYMPGFGTLVDPF